MVYIITGGFILLDMVTGLVKAFKEKAYTSSIMREGLYHKTGSALVITFATLVDFAQKYIDLGFTVPIVATVCGYIIAMEIGSIIENLCKINPEFMPAKLKTYFAKLNDKEN